MSDLVHITDHDAEARGRLAQQYVTKPKIQALVSALATRTQQLEDVIWQFATQRQLLTAVGAQLDTIGKILVQPRGAFNDDDYRLVLRAKALVLRSSGDAEALLAIYALLFPLSLIEYLNWGIAAFTIEVRDPMSHAEALLCVSFLRQARAGGVRGIFWWQETSTSHLFVLGDSADYPESTTLQGLGDATDGTSGGVMAGAAC